MVASGFYDWFDDIEVIKKSMRLIYNSLPVNGYFVFSIQAGHVALSLTNKIFKLHPIAAQDYFCNTKFREKLFKTLVGIIPIARTVTRQTKEEIFKDINQALRNNHSIIIYPEGTRGEDNTLLEFKTGVAHIAKMNPDIPVIPIYINGPDRILPKIDSLIVPFISDIYIADAEYYDNSSTVDFTHKIRQIIESMYLEHKKKDSL